MWQKGEENCRPLRHEICKAGLASDMAYHDGAQVDSRRGKGGHHDSA